jgi:hypothetical protein
MISRNPGRLAVLLMWSLMAVTAGIGLGFGWRGLWPQVLETPSVVFSPVTEVKEKGSEPGPYINYRVQRGDSLWNVATVLTGCGSDWAALWPRYIGHERYLEAGTVLEIPKTKMVVRWSWKPRD